MRLIGTHTHRTKDSSYYSESAREMSPQVNQHLRASGGTSSKSNSTQVAKNAVRGRKECLSLESAMQVTAGRCRVTTVFT